MSQQASPQEPVLGREQEAELFTLWSKNGDQEALRRLVCGNKGLLHMLAQEFRHRVPDGMYDDLVQEGQLGLLRAASREQSSRFDPSLGFRFSSYAANWVRANMREFVRRNFGPVRVGTRRAERRIFDRYFYAKRVLGPDATKECIAQFINVTVADLEEMLPRVQPRDISLNFDYERYNPNEPQFDGPSPEEVVAERDLKRYNRKALTKAIRALPPRERHIVRARFFGGQTLQDLGDRYGISRERVRQLEKRGLETLRKQLAEMITQ